MYSVALVHFRLDAAVRCCLLGDEKLVAKGGRAACRVVTDGGEVTLFFGRAPGVVAAAPIDPVVLPGGAHRRRRSPPRPYIDHAALILLYGCSPVSPRGAGYQLPPTVGYCGQDAAVAAADDDDMSSGRRCHPARCASDGRSRRASLGGCQF